MVSLWRLRRVLVLETELVGMAAAVAARRRVVVMSCMAKRDSLIRGNRKVVYLL